MFIEVIEYECIIGFTHANERYVYQSTGISYRMYVLDMFLHDKIICIHI
jgi:hypothetical protein